MKNNEEEKSWGKNDICLKTNEEKRNGKELWMKWNNKKNKIKIEDENISMKNNIGKINIKEK